MSCSSVGRVSGGNFNHGRWVHRTLTEIGYRKQVSEHLPVHLESPNAIDPAQTFTAFLISVVAGAVSRLAGGWDW